LGQNLRFGAHARGEAYYNSTVSSTGCLKHQGNLALISVRLVPTPEERLARGQCHFVLKVSENTKAISVLGAHAQGEACGKHRRIIPGVSKHQDDQGFW